MTAEAGIRAAMDLFDEAPCGYLFTSPDGTIFRVNRTFLAWTGYSANDLVDQKRFQELFTVPSAIFYETHFGPLLRMQGHVREITVDIRCADGSTLPALVNSTIQSTEQGEPQIIRTTVFDIRERRRYERELLLERRKAEQLADIVERASDAILTLTPDFRVLTWNRAAEKLFGYSAQEAIGNDVRELIVPAERRAESQHRLMDVLKGGGALFDLEYRNRAGEPIWASVIVSPHIEPPDEVVAVSAIIRDVRVRKETERALLRAERLASIGRMASALAHEINNPLTGALNSLYLVRTNSALPERQREHLLTAENELRRISHVTRQVLGFYRENTKRKTIVLADAVDAALLMVTPRLHHKQMQPAVELDRSLHVLGVSGELQQVVANLLLNSIDAVDENGRIVVKLSRNPARPQLARLTIADNGRGIPAAALSQIYEPLYTTKGNTSSGLGLWVSKEIIDRHESFIRLRTSTAGPRRGTTVEICVPIITPSS
jgi:PAS domain S-box-containing protein